VTDLRKPADDAFRAAKAAAVIGAVLAIGALLLRGPRAGSSVAVGAALAVANLILMRAIIGGLFRAPAEPSEPDETNADAAPREEAPETSKADLAWGVLASVKLVLLLGVFGFLLTRPFFDPMALLVGYGAMPLGILATALGARSREEP
jgi:hypothetical protein